MWGGRRSKGSRPSARPGLALAPCRSLGRPQPFLQQPFAGPFRFGAQQRRVGLGGVVDGPFVAAVAIALLDEGLQVERHVGVLGAQRHLDDRQALDRKGHALCNLPIGTQFAAEDPSHVGVFEQGDNYLFPGRPDDHAVNVLTGDGMGRVLQSMTADGEDPSILHQHGESFAVVISTPQVDGVGDHVRAHYFATGAGDVGRCFRFIHLLANELAACLSTIRVRHGHIAAGLWGDHGFIVPEGTTPPSSPSSAAR